MRRLIAITLGLMALVGIGFLALNPQILQSASDRAVRIVEFLNPEWGAQVRLGSSKPVSDLLAEKGFRLGSPAFIRIFKQESELELWLLRGDRFELFETYPICTWSGEIGPKLAEGDGQSPEGFYAVGLKQLNPNSNYFRAFNLGFPNAYDRTFGRSGSFLMVHGDCVSIGCYAMTDRVIGDIYTVVEAALQAGQSEVRVHAFPFRMTDKVLAEKDGHRWASYWSNLKEGYDFFERTKQPPKAYVCNGRYAFTPSATDRCEPIAAW
ncbi:L,D-transpeptidase family protein [Microvirga roseola]|uniref:L,D-transpeptidase family protein n=1 Tax=Microvirga roseola TaxID=2883126 RepID=UPI001E37701B|nr:murein L,D-transpeptidase family protein [Microvirga roseola]